MEGKSGYVWTPFPETSGPYVKLQLDSQSKYRYTPVYPPQGPGLGLSHESGRLSPSMYLVHWPGCVCGCTEVSVQGNSITAEQAGMEWKAQQPSATRWKAQQPSATGWTAQQPSTSGWMAPQPSTSGWIAPQPSTSRWIAPQPSTSGWADQQPSTLDWMTKQEIVKYEVPQQPITTTVEVLTQEEPQTTVSSKLSDDTEDTDGMGLTTWYESHENTRSIDPQSSSSNIGNIVVWTKPPNQDKVTSTMTKIQLIQVKCLMTKLIKSKAKELCEQRGRQRKQQKHRNCQRRRIKKKEKQLQGITQERDILAKCLKECQDVIINYRSL
ncbi:hypothetical protein KUDE01_020057 [Dissostichus eleginoides]|uniref:Uncharacterized protein n=1 Tax=Dissostichus eleginoides TaxID=100907 RepID=A0AAD9C7C3_DISEL|nr:hypothetical protein KUDE01_019784 [Dissostichus eleginoides]KAK1894599.1 hypothetical protein KUDE01_020057 [Dissostichus eleginoides]